MRVRVDEDTIREYNNVKRVKASKVITDVDKYRHGKVNENILNRLSNNPNDYIALYFSNKGEDIEFAVMFLDQTDTMDAFMDTLKKGYLDATESLIAFDVFGY